MLLPRVLLVSHEMTLSGAPIALAHLAQWLRAQAWEVTLLAPEAGPLAEKLDGVEMLYEPQLLIDPQLTALRRRAPEFDLVLANTIAAWQAVYAAHLEGVPALWYIHETRVGQALMRKIHMIEPTLALADVVVVPTQASARIYAPFRPRGIEVIAYGIPEIARRATSPNERLTFATIGTCEPRKGQDVLLAAMARLPAEVQARSAVRLAGRELEAEFCAQLRAAAASLPAVEFVGDLEHAAALQLLQQADALILPSRDETMPLILLEAMCLAKPIICTDVGGIAEWLRDGENALVVPPEKADALAQAMQRLVHDPALRERLAQAARATFAQHFTLEHFGEQFALIIKRAIGAAAARIA